jgi:hypothetical protein
VKKLPLFIVLLGCCISCAQQKPVTHHKPKCDTWEEAVEHIGPGWVCDEKQGWHIDEVAKERDEANMKACQENEDKNEDLIKRARTTVLTDEELNKLYSVGYGILLPMGCSYGNVLVSSGFSPDDMQKEFDELLAQQFRLRIIKANGGK